MWQILQRIYTQGWRKFCVLHNFKFEKKVYKIYLLFFYSLSQNRNNIMSSGLFQGATSSTFFLITVDVQDINDNSPVFVDTPYHASVNEVSIIFHHFQWRYTYFWPFTFQRYTNAAFIYLSIVIG